MRKTAKILSVLLTLCLLCGVMLSVVASADTESNSIQYHESLDISKHDSNVSWNFEVGSSVPTWSMGDGKTGSVKSLNNNGYYNVTISTDENNTSTANSSTSLLSIGKTIDGVSYITLDFEFGTDKYLYDSGEDGKFDTYSDEEPVGYDWIPAYGYNAESTNSTSNSPDNSNNRQFLIGYTRFTDGGKDLGLRDNNYVNFASVFVGYDVDTREYYLFVKGSDASVRTRYPIANEVGVYEHITKVYKIEASTTENYDYTITEYIYINGQYIGTVSNDFADYTVADGAEEGKEVYTSISASVINTWTDGYAKTKSYYYSYAFDNLAVNFYGSDYNTDPAEGEEDTVYGLDDFVEAGANDFICYCDDVLYNEKYVTPNPERYVMVGFEKYYIVDFANYLSALKLNVTEDSGNTYNNFSTDSYTMAAYDSSVTFTDNYRAKIYVCNKSNTTGDTAYPAHFTFQTKNGNDYLRFSYNPDHEMIDSVNDKAPEITIGATSIVTGYKYYVFDMDFGADKWAYKIDDVWQTGDTVPEGATDARVALPTDNMKLYSYDGKKGAVATIVYDTTAGKFYLQNYTDSSVKLPLSNEPGVFNHITGVYDIDNDKYYLYLDGVLLGSWDTTTTVAGRFSFTSVFTSAESKKTDNYSIAIDNVAMNWYGSDYNFAAENGLDKFDFNQSIYNCADVLYNKDTYAVAPNPERYIEVDGNKTYVINAGLDAINAMTGGENSVTTSVDVDAAPLNTLEAFNLTLVNGAKFNTSKSAFSYVSAGENAYIVSRIATEANVDLFGDMTLNLYVPIAENALTKIEGADSSIFADGKYKISWTPEIQSFATQDVVLYYGDAVSSTITLDVVKYATLVASSTDYACGSEAAVLVYEMMNYKAAVAEYAGESVSASYNEFIALYDAHENCTCKDTVAPTGTATELSAGVEIAYLLNGTAFDMIIQGSAVTAAPTVKYVKLGMGTETEEVLVTGEFNEAGRYYVISDIPAAYIARDMVIAIDGLDSINYNLAAYIANKEANGETVAVNVATAMYKYSIAAFDYKYLTSDEVTSAE